MISRLVIWGGREGLESHRHVLRHYHSTAIKLGIDSIWVSNQYDRRKYLTPGSTVLSIDVTGDKLGEALPGVDYILHNFDGSHPVCQTVEPERILRLQVYTNDSFGEQWAPFRHFDHAGQILFQPWGTDLLAEEFHDPIFNPASQEVTFVGAVWSDQYLETELGNKGVTAEVIALCQERRLKFRHLTQISDEENVLAVRNARLAPSFAGGWQVEHNYLPCRVFKNVSYGTLGVTNVPALAKRINCPEGTVAEKLDWALSLKRADYLEAVREQQKFVSGYSYRESITALNRAFEEIRG